MLKKETEINKSATKKIVTKKSRAVDSVKFLRADKKAVIKKRSVLKKAVSGKRIENKIIDTYRIVLSQDSLVIKIIKEPLEKKREAYKIDLYSRIFTPLARPIMKITSVFLIVLLNWYGFSAIGRTMSFLSDSEISSANDFIAGMLDFNLSSAADFAPSPLTPGGSATRMINVINNGNPFKYIASSSNFSDPLCDYITLEANVDGGATEYIGDLKGFITSPLDFSDPDTWEYKLILATNTPSSLDGATCNFKFIFFGSQTRHDLPLGGGFNDIEEIDNSITAKIPQNCSVAVTASSAPILAKLNNGTIVTDQVANSDDDRAYQSVSGTKYIYLDWAFSDLPVNASTTKAELTLEHREHEVNMKVQWWNGLTWINVCDPSESAGDIVSTCDLKSYIDNTNKSSEVKLRLKLTQNGHCHEELDWAKLEISYDKQVSCDICGNGILDSGEECDDSNTLSGDGCSSVCKNECYVGGATSSPVMLAKLDNGSIVTSKAIKSDDRYASQSVDNIPRYIYLNWQFSDLPGNIPANLAELTLEHREEQVAMAVEWWNEASSSWIQVCDPPENDTDENYTCDLKNYIDNTNKIADIKLRLALTKTGRCHNFHEYLDWASINLGWNKQISCSKCGNGLIEDNETCDDGNLNSGDGCGSTCQIERPADCMKINEVYYDPDSCHGNEYNEWIELYNVCDYAVDLKDWYFIDNGGIADKEKINQSYPIPAHSFVAIADNARTWSYWPLIPNNATKIALGGSRLFRGLGNNGDRILLYDALDNPADAMSYGSDISVLDPSVPDAARGHSLSRRPAGADTDTAADWIDTYHGSTPPGPNPGTNPHDVNGNLMIPTETNDTCCQDYGSLTDDNSDELAINPDLLQWSNEYSKSNNSSQNNKSQEEDKDVIDEETRTDIVNEEVQPVVENTDKIQNIGNDILKSDEQTLIDADNTGNQNLNNNEQSVDKPIVDTNESSESPVNEPAGTENSNDDNNSKSAVKPASEPAIVPETVNTSE